MSKANLLRVIQVIGWSIFLFMGYVGWTVALWLLNKMNEQANMSEGLERFIFGFAVIFGPVTTFATLLAVGVVLRETMIASAKESLQ